MAFKGKAPGSGSGEMSRRTKLLRPLIGLTEKEIAQARQLRRGGAEPDAIAEALALPLYSHMTPEQVDRVCREVEHLLA